MKEDYQLSTEDIHDVFPFLLEEEFHIFNQYAAVRSYEINELLMREGERSEWMGFILQGKVKIKKEAVFPGKFVLVAILERGAMVGELSTIDHSPRTAAVEALETCKILQLSADVLESFLKEHPLLAIKLLKWIIHIAGIRVRMADDRLAKLL